MDQLVQMIVQRTGISESQAREAVNMVLSYAKERLPEPMASQLDGVLAGNVSGDVAKQAMDGLGGLFGKK